MQTPADRTAKRIERAPASAPKHIPADRLARRAYEAAEPADRTALRR